MVGIDLTGLLNTGIGSIYALFSVDMAEVHALTLRKGSDLAFSLQLSSLLSALAHPKGSERRLARFHYYGCLLLIEMFHLLY